jgi:hypothetical protein
MPRRQRSSSFEASTWRRPTSGDHVPDTPLDREAIEHNLRLLGDRLGDLGARARLTVVGGSYMALLGLRASTMDVDTITRLDDVVRQAVADVGRELDLDPTWLNDRAFAFQPHVEAGPGRVMFEHPNLVIEGPSAEVVFLMKLGRAEQRDRGDLIALWPRTSFATPEAAALAYSEAYPHVPEDAHLAGYIAEIAAAAEEE